MTLAYYSSSLSDEEWNVIQPLIMYLDTGWIITFRLHNASSRVEPSLKFDVQLRGNPQELSTHHLPYLLP